MKDLFQRVGTLALLAGLLAVAAGCTGGSDAQPVVAGWAGGCGPGPRSAAGTSQRDKGMPSETVSHQVIIDNFTFNPATLTVPVGATVTWVNRDDVPHTATNTSKPKQFDSGALDTEDRYSHAFTEPGTYPYYCAIHPKMTAQIIVK